MHCLLVNGKTCWNWSWFTSSHLEFPSYTSQWNINISFKVCSSVYNSICGDRHCDWAQVTQPVCVCVIVRRGLFYLKSKVKPHTHSKQLYIIGNDFVTTEIICIQLCLDAKVESCRANEIIHKVLLNWNESVGQRIKPHIVVSTNEHKCKVIKQDSCIDFIDLMLQINDRRSVVMTTPFRRNRKLQIIISL